MDALEALMTRRSIRRYTDEPVSADQVETMLRAAMAAPSAGNQQPWRFVVVTDREALERIAATSPYAGMLAEAPVGLVVAGDTEDLRHPVMWQQDCSAAVQNILLAAHALGLGAVWLGYYPKTERSIPLKAILRMPEAVEPMAVIAVGHPAEVKGPSERYNADFVHHERW